MPAIPLYTSSPINPQATRATGATPATRHAPEGGLDDSVPAVNSATATATSSYSPSARPQQAAVPAPTRAAYSSQGATYTPTPTAPPPPSKVADAPPPPQPGAVPYAGFHSTQSASGRPSVPPPPRASEAPQSATEHTRQYDPFPSSTSAQTTSTATYPSHPPLPAYQQHPNLSMPTRAQPPAGVTSVSHDLSHPPGYIQDANTSFAERPRSPYRPFESGTAHPNQSMSGGILDGRSGQASIEEENQGLWNAAVSWAKTAGEKLSQGEQEVWKAINNQGK